MSKYTYIVPITQYDDPDANSGIGGDFALDIFNISEQGVHKIDTGNIQAHNSIGYYPGVSNGGCFATLASDLYFIRSKSRSDISYPVPNVPVLPADWAAPDFYTVRLSTNQVPSISQMVMQFPGAEGVNAITSFSNVDGDFFLTFSRRTVAGPSKLQAWKLSGFDVAGVPTVTLEATINNVYTPYDISILELNGSTYAMLTGKNVADGFMHTYTVNTGGGSVILTRIQELILPGKPCRGHKWLKGSSNETLLGVATMVSIAAGNYDRLPCYMYKWNGAGLSSIPVFTSEDMAGARGVETFEMNNDKYVMFTGFGYPFHQNLKNPVFTVAIQYPYMQSLCHLYRYDPTWIDNNASSPLVKVQTMSSLAYRNATFIPNDNGDGDYLMFSPTQYRTNEHRGLAPILKWNSSLNRFTSFSSIEAGSIIDTYVHQVTLNDAFDDSDVEVCPFNVNSGIDPDICATTSVPFSHQTNYINVNILQHIYTFSTGSKYNLLICNRSNADALIDVVLNNGVVSVKYKHQIQVLANDTLELPGILAATNTSVHVESNIANMSITCNGYSY